MYESTVEVGRSDSTNSHETVPSTIGNWADTIHTEKKDGCQVVGLKVKRKIASAQQSSVSSESKVCCDPEIESEASTNHLCKDNLQDSSLHISKTSTVGKKGNDLMDGLNGHVLATKKTTNDSGGNRNDPKDDLKQCATAEKENDSIADFKEQAALTRRTLSLGNMEKNLNMPKVKRELKDEIPRTGKHGTCEQRGQSSFVIGKSHELPDEIHREKEEYRDPISTGHLNTPSLHKVGMQTISSSTCTGSAHLSLSSTKKPSALSCDDDKVSKTAHNFHSLKSSHFLSDISLFEPEWWLLFVFSNNYFP